MKFIQNRNLFAIVFAILLVFTLSSKTTRKIKSKNKNGEKFKLCISSWNVGENDPPANLANWIKNDCQMIVVGTQETVNLGVVNTLSDSAIAHQVKKWREAILNYLQHNYTDIEFAKNPYLMGIMLLVFVKNDILTNFRNENPTKLDHFREKTGMNGLVGNKGAVSFDFLYKGKTFSITNTHLAAHDNEHEKRMGELRLFLSKSYKNNLLQKKANEHDAVIIFGDLNSRTDYIAKGEKAKENKDVKNLIAANDLSFFSRDQLHKALEGKTELPGMTELQPTFFPTYKFDPNTDNYDTSEKQRIPSWCDRIIYNDNEFMKSAKKSFESIMSLKQSDHKPVVGTFTFKLK